MLIINGYWAFLYEYIYMNLLMRASPKEDVQNQYYLKLQKYLKSFSPMAYTIKYSEIWEVLKSAGQL